MSIEKSNKAAWLAAILLSLVVLARAFVAEDAYITFRVIDNLMHGHGLVWNLGERVQAYTHPLWLFLHLPFYVFTDNLFLISLTLCFLCSAAAAVLLLRAFPGAAMLLVMLAMSRSFTLYSTSGFENPLTHLLFAAFGYVLWRGEGKYFWLGLSLCTSLALCARLDMATFYAPIWLMLLMLKPRWRQVALGALPIVLWELFSLFYYGFLFPNTKYAKLDTGIAAAEYLQLGLSYLLNLAAMDPAGALMIAAAIILLPWLAWRWWKTRARESLLLLALSAGIACHVAYIVAIGGTYLSGRFLSLPIFAAGWLLFAQWRERALLPWVVAVAIIVYFFPPEPKLRAACQTCFNGVDPAWYEEKITLQDWLAGKPLPQPGSMPANRPIAVAGSIGRWGYSMSRQVKIIDNIAISDALLSRLPVKNRNIPTMGILPRAIPDGYLQAALTGDVSGMDPDLGLYYSKLRLIISGDLWSRERLAEIVKFNLGEYDHLRDAYVQKLSQ